MSAKEKINIAIIVGAGNGQRFGGDKIFSEINNRPVWYYSAQTFQSSEKVDEIIMVVKEEKIKQVLEEKEIFGLNKINKIVAGGKERKNSVFNALEMMDKNDANLVLIHDGARPFVSRNLIERSIDETNNYGAVVPGILPRDTVKYGDKFVEKTLNRNNIYLIQTPQVFEYDIIMRAYENAFAKNIDGTDDSSLVENLGYRVKIIPGEESNIKITHQGDLEWFSILVRR